MEILELEYAKAFAQTKRVYEYEYCGYEWVYITMPFDGNYYIGKNPTPDYQRWGQVSAVLYSLKNHNDITRFP